MRPARATALAAAQKLADFVAHQEETLRVRFHRNCEHTPFPACTPVRCCPSQALQSATCCTLNLPSTMLPAEASRGRHGSQALSA